MKIALSWLSDFITVNAGISTPEIERGLIQLGHEVEGIHSTRPPLAKVVVGHVLSRVPHPNAEKLGVCMVDAGEDAPRQIVCGAPNARAGITVAVALPGAVLPGDFTIKTSTIRGTESHGMLCSVKELGVGDEHDGIWEIATAAKPGTLLEEAGVLPPAETVLDVSLTPNRGDCFSHLGLARELAALGLGTLTSQPALTFSSNAQPSAVAQVEAAACPQLNLLPIEGLAANAPSPAWVQQRLRAVGVTPRNAVVDVTNYLMLALGQPMHAYDAAHIKGPLTARMAHTGENINALNDITYTLTEHDLVIADETGPQGLAGIIGGAHSAVSETTTRIILEAAVFESPTISLSGQRHAIHTDARQRFERGTDPAMAQHALRMAAAYLQEWAGTPHTKVGLMATAGAGPAAPEPIRYHPAFFTRYIGIGVADNHQQQILESLGFTVKPIMTGWLITPPTWRTYMATPEDITEEVLRVVGYETVPHQLPTSMPGQFAVDGRAVELDRKARKALAQHGFLEAMTYSFIGAEVASAFNPHTSQPLTLVNPLAQTDMTTMRPSLLPGLLAAVGKNHANSEATAKLAEVGKVYHASGEQLSAAGVIMATGQRHWQQAEATPDVFTAKAAAMSVLEALGAPVSSGTVTGTTPAYYHPGRSGTLQVGPFVLAHFGELHPALRAQQNIPASAGPLAVFEIMLDPLLKLQNKPKTWQPFPYPPVKRDVSLVVKEGMSAAEMMASISKYSKNVSKHLVLDAEVFDVYRGAGVPEGHYALGIALSLQSTEKTLSEADIDQVIAPLIQILTSTPSVTLRG